MQTIRIMLMAARVELLKVIRIMSPGRISTVTRGQPKDNRTSTQGQGNVNDNDNENDNEHDNAHVNVNENVNVNDNKEFCPYVDKDGIITDWEKFQEWKRKHPDWKGADD